MRLDLLVRERFPDGGFLAGLRGALICSGALGELGLRDLLGFVDCAVRGLELLSASVDIIAEAVKLVMKRRLGLLRLRRRHERARIEFLVVAEAPLEPDRQLARHAELMKRFAVVALAFVDGGVADAAQIVKHRPLRGSDDIAAPKAIDEQLLTLFSADEEADLRGSTLREHFAELPQLDERDRGIAREVLLRLRRERDESCIV